MWRVLFLFVVGLATALGAKEPAFDMYAEGREVYAKRCLPCHIRKKIDYEPSAYSQRALWEMVKRMAPMSKLDHYETMAVQSYLEAARKGVLKVPGIGASPTNKPSASPATAQELYVARCTSCHAHKVEPINPTKYNEAKLKSWMQRMAPISKFTPAETELVGRYLEDVRTGKTTLPGASPAKRN
jgi:cytochrome c5